jgi:alpha-amylase
MNSSRNGVMFQAFHWYTEPKGNFWNDLASRAEELFKKGFTSVWIPPAYKGNSGGLDVGYAVYDMYDLGEFDQKGSVRTKYGTIGELKSATKKLRDCGVRVYLDVVLNHRIGGDEEEEILATPHSDDNRHQTLGETRNIRANTKFTFPGRGDKYSKFKWSSEHFTAVDFDLNNPDDHAVYLFAGKTFDEKVDLEKGSFDYLMGCDVDVKHHDVQHEIKSWGSWYYDTVGLDGVRFDAVKHVEAGFFPDWLRHLRNHSQQPIFAVGEYWSYHVDALHSFIEATGGDVHLFDAPLLRNFSNASRSGNSYDLRQMFDNALVKDQPSLAVTIVANHDTQPLQALENVVEAWFTPIAYALTLLRRDGYPCVFCADYDGAEYTDKGRDGFEHHIVIPSHRFLIDIFLDCRRDHAYGDQNDYFDHPNCCGWTRMGDSKHGGGMAVVISNGEAGVKRMSTGHPNVVYVDCTGHVTDRVTTDSEGFADFRCLGRSVSVWLPE